MDTNIVEQPTKKPNRKSNKSLSFLVSQHEYDLIKGQMAQAGTTNLRAYLLKMALNGRIIHVELDSIRDMVRLLSNATNNINQISRRVNQTGNIYASDVDDLHRRYNELWTQTKEILHCISVL